MRTPISATEPAAAESGFTLIELLAVLTILSIAAALYAFNGQAGFGTAKFRTLLTDAASAIRQTRSEAITSAAERVIIVDVAGRRIGAVTLPEGVTLRATVAQSETRGAAAGIRFYKDGSSSGGTLDLSWRDRRAAIDINWLTGNVAIRGL